MWINDLKCPKCGRRARMQNGILACVNKLCLFLEGHYAATQDGKA